MNFKITDDSFNQAKKQTNKQTKSAIFSNLNGSFMNIFLTLKIKLHLYYYNYCNCMYTTICIVVLLTAIHTLTKVMLKQNTILQNTKTKDKLDFFIYTIF